MTIAAICLGLVMLTALLVAALFLAHTQADQRRDLRDRYVQRTAVASGLIEAIFRVAFRGQARDASQLYAGPRVRRDVLDVAAANNNVSYMLILDASGRALGMSSHVPPGTAQRLAGERAFLRTALRAGNALGNVTRGRPDVVESAVAFQTPTGSRLQVNATPLKIYADFLGGTLRPLPTLRGSEAFVLDGHGISLGSIDSRGDASASA